MGTTRRSTGVFPAIPRFLCWDIGPLAHTLHTTKTPEGRSATFRVQGSGFFSLLLFLVFECYFLFVFFFEKYLWASIAARSLKPFWPKKQNLFFGPISVRWRNTPPWRPRSICFCFVFLFFFKKISLIHIFVVVKKTGKKVTRNASRKTKE